MADSGSTTCCFVQKTVKMYSTSEAPCRFEKPQTCDRFFFAEKAQDLIAAIVNNDGVAPEQLFSVLDEYERLGYLSSSKKTEFGQIVAMRLFSADPKPTQSSGTGGLQV